MALLHQLKDFLALAAHAVARAEQPFLIKRIVLEAFDFDIARIDGVLQRIDFRLIKFNIVGYLVLLLYAVLAEHKLEHHRRCGEDSQDNEYQKALVQFM